MYRLVVGLRYLYRKRLNILAIVGVAIGVMALLVVLSVMTGFDKEMRSRIRGTLSDLIVENLAEDEFKDYEEVIAKLEALDHVEACSPHLDGLALVKLEDKLRYAAYRGIELDRECQATDLAEYWRTSLGNTKLRECRNILRLIENPFEAPGGNWAAEETWHKEVVSLARAMRQKDFAKLTKERQKQIRTWADEQGVDLESGRAEAERQTPSWGPALTGEEEKWARVIAGEDLLVLGLLSDGTVASLKVGDKMVAVTFLADKMDRRVKSCVIVDKFKSGMYEYDAKTFYMPLKDAQRFAFKSGRVTSIAVRLDDYRNADSVRAAIMGIPTYEELARMNSLMKPLWKEMGRPEAAGYVDGALDELRVNYSDWSATVNPKLITESIKLQNTFVLGLERLSEENLTRHSKRIKELHQLRKSLEERQEKAPGLPFWASTWESKRRNILRAVAVERKVMAVILFFLFILAGFLILALLHTTVVEKTKDIGILKSLGGTVRGIMSIFLLNGFLIGLFGAGLGTLGGILMCRHLNDLEDLIFKLTRWRVFPREVYAFDKIPVDQDPGLSILIIAGAAVVMSFLASLYPAYKAAKLNPVEALRYE